ncbi:hypothetical protein B0H11DRAFT_1900104 [Mycena galericulata]|nr:hypothetical protein B0H11DRAFT_1900104 [Mycena galericulata]
MSKSKSRRKIIPNPDWRYRPKIASAKHYARNPEIRERRRIQAAEKRAAIKLNRRRRDPPKKFKAVESGNGEPPAEVKADDCPSRNENEADYNDYDLSSHSKPVPSPTTHSSGRVQRSKASEEVDRGTAPSPTPDERIASQALAALATGVAFSVLSPIADSIDSILDMANQLSVLSSSVAAGPLWPPSELRGNGDWVQLALTRVAALSVGPLTPPTEEDAAQWHLRPYIGGGGVDGDMHIVISVWRLEVDQAMMRARIDGAVVRDGVILVHTPTTIMLTGAWQINIACFVGPTMP